MSDDKPQIWNGTDLVSWVGMFEAVFI